MRRRSLALAGPPKSAKNRGVRLFKTVRLIRRIRYTDYCCICIYFANHVFGQYLISYSFWGATVVNRLTH